VKNLKLLILAFGALGLISLLMEFEMFKLLLTHPFEAGGFGLMVIGGFVLATAMGVIGVAKPPFMPIHAILALVGFALPCIKLQIWDALPHIMDAPTSAKLMIVAMVGGVIVSILAIVKPESKA
jgi:hypothetical protein